MYTNVKLLYGIPEINTVLPVNFISIHTPKCICIKHVRMADCGSRRMKTGIRIKEKKIIEKGLAQTSDESYCGLSEK